MEPSDTQLPATITQAEIIAPSDTHTTLVVPVLIADLGDDASWRYVEFFTANIRNPHTRRAYARACSRFFGWCEQRGLALASIRPFDVAAYIEFLQQQEHSAPGVKQQLAAIRMLFDWLITGQVLPTNPAAAVRGPKHVVRTGKTPVLEGAEWRTLLDSIPATTLRDLRDRALIATLTYSFARINAALKMKVEDLRPRGAAWTIRLHEKGGKQHAMPCHHALAEALRAYIDGAGIVEDRKGWLFRTARGHNGSTLSDKPMSQPDAWRMIRRRAAAAGIAAEIGCHTFRATGITAYLSNGGALEHAQEMAAHESPRTTKLRPHEGTAHAGRGREDQAVSAATAIESDFQLQFAPVEIPVLAHRYMDAGSEEDEKAFAAGTRIRDGDFSRDNLQAIFWWKTKGRGVSRLARNTDDEIADALKLALNAKTGRSSEG